LDLDPDYLGPPDVGCFVEDLTQLGVDGLTGSERIIEIQVADDVTQVGLRQLGGRQNEVLHLVGEPDRVCGSVVDNGVDGDDHVVLRDDLLWRDVDDDLPHVDPADPVDERHDQVQPRVQRLAVLAEALYQSGLVLPHDLEPQAHIDDQQQRDSNEDNDVDHVVLLSSFLLRYLLTVDGDLA